MGLKDKLKKLGGAAAVITHPEQMMLATIAQNTAAQGSSPDILEFMQNANTIMNTLVDAMLEVREQIDNIYYRINVLEGQPKEPVLQQEYHEGKGCYCHCGQANQMSSKYCMRCGAEL